MRPTPHRRTRILGTWLLSLLQVVACRYSVRDTGFVDLGAEPYRLVLHHAAALPDEVRLAYRRAAAAALLDANIVLDTEGAAPPPPSPPAEPALVLTAPGGRSLTVASGPDLPRTPTAILDLLEKVALSPARIRLHDELLRAFAVLILVEGRDPDANDRVRRLLHEAASAIERLMPGMPKPVRVPPVVLTVPTTDVPAESVLLWGLGLDPVVTDDPRVALAFGRGRRLGDPVEGPLVTRTLIQDRLAIIGQDCECELDRSWLQGPVIPARWDAARQRAAAEALGFDPENPLLRAEVSQIVLRGALNPGRKRAVSGAFDALALGYSEVEVEPLPATDPVALAASDTPPAVLPSPGPTATVAPAPSSPSPPPAARSTPPSSAPPPPASRPGPPPPPEPAPASAGSMWAVAFAFAFFVGLAGTLLWLRSRRDRP